MYCTSVCIKLKITRILTNLGFRKIILHKNIICCPYHDKCLKFRYINQFGFFELAAFKHWTFSPTENFNASILQYFFVYIAQIDIMSDKSTFSVMFCHYIRWNYPEKRHVYFGDKREYWLFSHSKSVLPYLNLTANKI